ncbi:hypothetical protein MTR_3g061660 [Medicago truncatula]|uniref:Uncharacterized protein n=1 Tax=Medicago truncatula TaxID=3880 RepID=G7J269_MEDTR|nr:hypothetical protein MTR_3g061660 [Medicago truncatula]
MEKLTLLIREKMEMNQWQPIKININGSAMFHIFFVDDCLLFAKVTPLKYG